MIVDIQSLVRDTIREPQVAARRLIALNLPFEMAIFAVIGSISASVIVSFIMSGMRPLVVEPGGMTIGPLLLATIIAALTVMVIVALTFAGKPFNGTGTLAQTAVLVAWTQILQLGTQVIQLILASVSFFVAGIFGLGVMVFMLWVLVNFINALHQLNSNGKAIVVLLLAVVGIALCLSFITTILGIGLA